MVWRAVTSRMSPLSLQFCYYSFSYLVRDRSFLFWVGSYPSFPLTSGGPPQRLILDLIRSLCSTGGWVRCVDNPKPSL